MGQRHRRVDAYIARSRPFAQPILRHLREVVHGACPDADEAIKWGMPFFVRDGKLFAFMASFTRHAAFGFRHGTAVVGERKALERAMGQFGRITALRDLPGRATIAGYVKRAAALQDADAASGAKPPRTGARRVIVPADLRAALAKSAKARQAFEGFSPSHQREYVEWITGAKREATRARRLATALQWMAEGKTQNWRYER